MIWVFIKSQIKSFCPNLFLTYDLNNNKNSQFDQLNYIMQSKNEMHVHLVTNKVISSQPFPELQFKTCFQKFLNFINLLRICHQKNEMSVYLVTN